MQEFYVNVTRKVAHPLSAEIAAAFSQIYQYGMFIALTFRIF